MLLCVNEPEAVLCALAREAPEEREHGQALPDHEGEVRGKH